MAKLLRMLALGATCSAALAACGTEPSQARDALGPDGDAAVAGTLVLTPDTVITGPGGEVQFVASDSLPDGSLRAAAVQWSARAGEVDSSGLYTAPSELGTFPVTARLAAATREAVVRVETDVEARIALAVNTSFWIEVAPGSMTLAPGQSVQFTGGIRTSSGQFYGIQQVWTATGGDISSTGRYTAPATSGQYQVILRRVGDSLADTALVTVRGGSTPLPAPNPPVPANPQPTPPSPTPTPPPPTNTRSSFWIEVQPAAVNLAPGAARQFTVVGKSIDGRTWGIRAVWRATGGTISSTGRYVAPSSAGTYRVIVEREGDPQRVDTAVVTVGSGGSGSGTPAPTLSRIELTPATATLAAGATRQFSVVGRMTNNSTSAVNVNYSATGGTITPAGLFTAGSAAGTFRVIAVRQGGTQADTSSVSITAASPAPTPTPPPPSNGVADPTLLPAATGQHPASGTYGRSLAAGQTYVDPNTNVTVLKLTSASVPAANSGMYHGYSEGGPTISQAWTGSDGQVYYTAKVGGWLVDVRYGTLTPTNWRRVSASGETLFAFSLNPATPRIAYMVTGGKRVERYNTATNQVENTGSWPWVITAAGDNAAWLQTQVNDTWLTLMLNSNSTVVSFRPADGFQRVVTESGAGVSIDEPHLDREFPVVYLSTNSSVQNKIVNLATGTYVNPGNQGIINDDHNAPLRGKIVGISWQANAVVAVDYQGNTTTLTTRSPTDWSGDYHMAGQWVFNNPSQYFAVDQWQDTGNYPIYKGMIGFVGSNDMRLLAAHDAQGTGYNTGGQPHPTLAPDGKFIMWTSNMNNSGRYDTFLARVPVR